MDPKRVAYAQKSDPLYIPFAHGIAAISERLQSTPLRSETELQMEAEQSLCAEPLRPQASRPYCALGQARLGRTVVVLEPAWWIAQWRRMTLAALASAEGFCNRCLR